MIEQDLTAKAKGSQGFEKSEIRNPKSESPGGRPPKQIRIDGNG